MYTDQVQSGYASDLLFIGNLCFAKLSVVLMLWTLSPVRLHRRIALALGLAIIFWAFTSEFVAAFQCSTPESWRLIGNKCINQNAFWTYFGILNIITDAALTVLPLAIIWKLQMDKRRKFSIACCFGTRTLVIASAIAQLAYLHRASGTADFTYRLWPVVLCNQLVQNIGIVTACVPYIKPFLESLESGMIRTDDLRRRGVVTSAYGYSSFSKTSGGRPAGPPAASSSSYKLSQLLSRTAGASVSPSRDSSTVNTVASAGDSNDTASLGQNFATVTAGARGLDLRSESIAESQKSSSRIIKQTTTWEVQR
ncbi:hypothetical protein OEA41_005725 [Lepraria neglecta]|uniref:Rhodopsin domain-containing protein n=1 Tax=Lepraria neglecta TaxID=209136 RepID=A0AAE0DJV6_9LECA|nr:hypothetical protein OEA41_005725 [Lepraria neglecta]